ncbi:MAG: hypothetical protein U0R24_12920 [Solirubrobacterales bacterium]
MPVAAPPHHHEMLLRNLDILALLIALPVFILADAPLIGWFVVGAAWVAGRIGTEMADRRRRDALSAGNRNAALGVTAAAMMGRLWILAGAILLVGLLAERDAGLAGAVLALVLVTISLCGQFAEHVLHPEAEGSLR